MGLVERRNSPARVRGRERGFEVQLGELGGFELRPTRLFLWPGLDREGQARVVSLGRAPRNLLLPRKESEYRAGALRVRSVGNPLMTVALAAVQTARAVKRRGSSARG
ncbi:MAG TPA: hypothetical protein VFW80_08050 [Gaiellaceae bacterium]|nr:hypothetical protein [Gaiellaceae bacterium]